MSIRKCQFVFVVMVLGMGVVSKPAEASGLIGSTLEWQYYAGGSALLNNADSNTGGSFVDTGTGVGGTFIEPLQGSSALTVFNIDATATTITFDYSVGPASDSWNSPTSIALAPTIYNGIAISLLSAGTFLNVSIDPATNMDGFVASDLSFTGDQIEVNWAGLDFTNTTEVVLDVTSGATSSVPEPGTIVLFLTAGVSLFLKVARSHAPGGRQLLLDDGRIRVFGR